jgi:hypothetical protein
MGNFVPGKSFQIPDGNQGVRRLTPERVAWDVFGRNFTNNADSSVSSFLMEQRSWVLDPGICYPAGVMYRRIINGRHLTALDPHVKEVGKK